jgi:hypothetical protein
MPAMGYQNVQQQIRIAGIVLGPAGVKRFAHFGHRYRIDGIQVQKLDMHQCVDQGAAFLFHGDRYRFAPKTVPQRLNPVLQSFWGMVQCESLPLIAARFLQRDGMFLIGPIQADKCGNFDILFRHH